MASGKFATVLFTAGALTIVGCRGSASNMQAPAGSPVMMDEAAITKAVAKIGPSKAATTQPTNNDVKGTITFSLSNGMIKFVADVDGLAPNSEHGFHIHEKGDLSDPELKSAGGHFNPTKEKHGGPETEHHHAGDLGNLKADDKGHAHLEGMVMHAGFTGDESIIGKSVIIHAKPDDLKTDPSGNSGARVAGGEIKAG